MKMREYEGYEYAILCEVQNRIGDQYNMDIVMDEWTNLLVGIDTGNYAAAGRLFWIQGRARKKYSYSAVPIVNADQFYIGYLEKERILRIWHRFAGKTVATTPGLLARRSFLTGMRHIRTRRFIWSTRTAMRRSVPASKNGLYDAYIASSIEMLNFNAQYDNFMDVSKDSVYQSDNGGIYFLFSKE